MEAITLNPEYWNQEYQNQYAEKLERETIRYSSLASLIKRWSCGTSVLDLGCGVGTMRKYLSSTIRYIGVDTSEVALSQARHLSGGVFVCDAIELYSPHELFDVILFNECLYYLKDPLAIIHRYSRFLKDNGILLASVYKPNPSHRSYGLLRSLTKELQKMSECVHSQIIVSPENMRWTLIVFKNFTRID